MIGFAFVYSSAAVAVGIDGVEQASGDGWVSFQESGFHILVLLYLAEVLRWFPFSLLFPSYVQSGSPL